MELLQIYKDYCDEINNTKDELKLIKVKYNDRICDFVIRHSDEFNGVLTNNFNIKIDNFIHEIQKNLYSKICRMYKIENKKGKMSNDNILENIECAFKSAYYMHFRYLYNYKEELDINEQFSSAIFYFIR